VRNLHFCTTRVSAENWHLDEIAWIVLPTECAMCEVLWYGMALVAHPHGYPHTMHNFCGHREWGCECPAPLSPFISRNFMQVATKTLCGN